MGLVVWGQELLQSWGVTPKDDRKPRPETCVFCAKIAARVADPASDDAFVHVDDDLVVFRDWKPAARRHYLVCPRAHVSSARALTPADARLARRIAPVARRPRHRPRLPGRPARDEVRLPHPSFQQRRSPAHARLRAPFRARVEGEKIQRRGLGQVRVSTRRGTRRAARGGGAGRRREGEGEGNGERGGCSGGEGEGNGETGGVSSAKL